MVDEQSFTSDLLPPLSSQLGPNSRSCSLSNDSLGHPCQSSFPPISSCLVSKALRDMEGRHGRHQIQEYQLFVSLSFVHVISQEILIFPKDAIRDRGG